MATYKTYGSGASTNGYRWTGLNLENQVASIMKLSEKISATSISVYVGGYGGSAPMQFAIWNSSGSLVVRSGTITVPKGSLSRGGQTWNTASISTTVLNPGNYYVGFWCNPSYRRVWTKWTAGVYSQVDYRKTGREGIVSMSGNSTDGSGVLAAYVTGTPYTDPDPDPPPSTGGLMWIKDGSSWKKSKGVWVKDGSTWKKSKGIFIKDGSTWKESK